MYWSGGGESWGPRLPEIEPRDAFRAVAIRVQRAIGKFQKALEKSGSGGEIRYPNGRTSLKSFNVTTATVDACVTTLVTWPRFPAHLTRSTQATAASPRVAGGRTNQAPPLEWISRSGQRRGPPACAKAAVMDPGGFDGPDTTTQPMEVSSSAWRRLPTNIRQVLTCPRREPQPSGRCVTFLTNFRQEMSM